MDIWKEHRIILPLLTADFIITHEKFLDKIAFTLYDDEYFNRTSVGNSMYLIDIKNLLNREGERYLSELYESPLVSYEETKTLL